MRVCVSYDCHIKEGLFLKGRIRYEYKKWDCRDVSLLGHEKPGFFFGTTVGTQNQARTFECCLQVRVPDF
jgi:hypothetical protein